MTPAAILDKVAAYYGEKLRTFGPTPRGVDWNGAESQRLRFAQLLRLRDTEDACSLLDFGCGYGALFDYLAEQRSPVAYVGFDVSPEMIRAAHELHPASPAAAFTTRESELSRTDYVVASGIFNVKLDVVEAEWAAYVRTTLDAMAALARRGFAFNLLTRYCDPERRRPDLYYGDPLALFDHCRTRFSRRVALLHDYPLYEFTIVVRTDPDT
jgi:SAM-dependent methyltransferase